MSNGAIIHVRGIGAGALLIGLTCNGKERAVGPPHRDVFAGIAEQDGMCRLEDLGLHVRSGSVKSTLSPLGVDLPCNSEFGGEEARYAERHQDAPILDESGELSRAGQAHSTAYIVGFGVLAKR